MDSNKKKGKAIMKKDDKDQTKEVQENNKEIKTTFNPWACSGCNRVCDDMSDLAIHKSKYHNK